MLNVFDHVFKLLPLNPEKSIFFTGKENETPNLIKRLDQPNLQSPAKTIHNFIFSSTPTPQKRPLAPKNAAANVLDNDFLQNCISNMQSPIKESSNSIFSSTPTSQKRPLAPKNAATNVLDNDFLQNCISNMQSPIKESSNSIFSSTPTPQKRSRSGSVGSALNNTVFGRINPKKEDSPGSFPNEIASPVSDNTKRISIVYQGEMIPIHTSPGDLLNDDSAKNIEEHRKRSRTLGPVQVFSKTTDSYTCHIPSNQSLMHQSADNCVRGFLKTLPRDDHYRNQPLFKNFEETGRTESLSGCRKNSFEWGHLIAASFIKRMPQNYDFVHDASNLVAVPKVINSEMLIYELFALIVADFYPSLVVKTQCVVYCPVENKSIATDLVYTVIISDPQSNIDLQFEKKFSLLSMSWSSTAKPALSLLHSIFKRFEKILFASQMVCNVLHDTEDFSCDDNLKKNLQNKSLLFTTQYKPKPQEKDNVAHVMSFLYNKIRGIIVANEDIAAEIELEPIVSTKIQPR